MDAPRTLLASLAAAPRLAAARAWLARPAAAPALVLAASRRAGQQLVREAALAGAAVVAAEVATTVQLAAELALLAGDERVPLTPLGAEAVAGRAIARCQAAAPLAWFAAVVDAPGLPRAVVRTLRELREHGVAPEALRELGARGEDLARLLAAFDAELRNAALADAAAALRRAAEAIAGGAADRHRGYRLLLLDLPLRSPCEAALVAALAARGGEVLALAPAADAAGITTLERTLGVTVRSLDARDQHDLARARRHVFRADAPTADGPPDGSCVLFSAPGEGAECVEIARRLLALARAGVPFDRCAVLLRDPERYQPLLEHALDRAGIAALFTRGVVRPHPAGRAFLALLDCANERLSANRFAEYLGLGQVPAVDAAGAPPPRPVPWMGPDEEEALGARERPAPAGEQLELFSSGPRLTAEGEVASPTAATETDEDDASPVIAGSLRTPLHWERLLVEASVVGGLDRWRRRLAGLAAELALQLAACERDEPARAERLRRQLARLETLERFALPLVEQLAALPESASWGEWLAALEALAARALREPERVLQTLAELRPMAEVGPLSLGEVRQALAQRLANLRASPEGPPFGRLFVGALDEARGRSFHTVLVPGLVEGVFPRRTLEDPLLPDADRTRLAAGLAVQDDRIGEERLLLALALGAAEEGIVASYPTLDGREGRQRVPSFYALDLMRAAEGTLPPQDALLRRAGAASALRQGWPAPRAAEDALDEEEHDLAVLAALLGGSAAETRGRARFLLRLDPTLDRALRARWQRWNPQQRLTPADGLLDLDSAAREALAAHGLGVAPGNRAYSPTALQHLAACPYRFLLAAVHGLRPREETGPLAELDPLTKGEIFHAVQAALLAELKRRGLLPLAAAQARAALDLLDEVLDRLAAGYRERLVPALPRVWESEVEEMRVDLRGWVREMAAATEAGPQPGPLGGPWVPGWFELAFGLPAEERRDPASRRAPVDLLGKLRLRGSIDLVETTPDGAWLRATDHKTGLAPDTRRVETGGGESLQPLLYALAAAEVLGKPARAGRLYYCTRRGGYRSYEVPVHELSLLPLREVIDLAGDLLARGWLPALPREGACARCDYRPVCGPHEEARTRDKKGDPELLRRLREVREHE